MPIYEYQCQRCGIFEVTQRITERALAKCPTCRGKVKKLISNTSFQLKGTGWYITDYARKDQSASKAENGAKAPADSKTESKKTDTEKSDTAKSTNDKSSTASSSSA